jgi:hypothetical protein
MSIKYEPSKLIRKIAPRSKVAKLVTSRLTLKKAALSFVSEFDFLDKQAIARVALKAIKSYKTRVKEDPDLRADLVDDPALLVQRVQNEVVTQIAGEIRDNYAGEFYIWLPSSAEEPDPEHQLNYGQKFQVGDGEQPGDRYGCQCGMEILVDGSTLEL